MPYSTVIHNEEQVQRFIHGVSGAFMDEGAQ